jgi:VWFA-related protein
MPKLTSLSLVAVVLASCIPVTPAQSGRGQEKKPEPVKKSAPAPAEQVTSPSQDKVDPAAIKLEATLITVPTVVGDRGGRYIPDMRKDEFTLLEDGVSQEVVFYAAVKEPFNVILMLDTSGSTREKLAQIQQAAKSFVDQLQPDDKVKVMSFDDEIRGLSDFTSDRAELRRAIDRTRPGQGTRLYDAMYFALGALQAFSGRKSIVLFTDGVDMRSDLHQYDDTMRLAEECGLIIYPIRYDTRHETEALVRGQQSIPDIGVILGGPPIGTTPPTTPGGTPIPTGPPSSSIPPVIINRPRNDPRYPDDRRNDPRFPDPGPRDPTIPDSSRRAPPPGRNDPISVELDQLYATADRYLTDLAGVTGGKLHRADTLGSLPKAFGEIAAELRTQYSLGYYPTNTARDGKYRQIKVQTSRKGAVVRARPGYRAPASTP